PNKADAYRTISIWLPQTEEYMDFTFNLEEFKSSKMKVGDQITIQIDKRFDVDSFTSELFKT
ncbi:MAG: hypothetical protein ACE5G1_15150, partial [bacterium]